MFFYVFSSNGKKQLKSTEKNRTHCVNMWGTLNSNATWNFHLFVKCKHCYSASNNTACWLFVMNFETMIICLDDPCCSVLVAKGLLLPSSKAIKKTCMLMSLKRKGLKTHRANASTPNVIKYHVIQLYRIFKTRRICMKTTGKIDAIFILARYNNSSLVID